MKKLISALLLALMVFVGVSQPAHAATDRVTKTYKICRYDFTGLSADTMLTLADGTSYCDISDIIPERVVIENNVTTLTGTSVVFKVLTTSDQANAGATTDPGLTGSDGSTALVSATITATGRYSKGTSVPQIGGSGVGTNLGTRIGVWADVTSVSALTGTAWIIVVGRP